MKHILSIAAFSFLSFTTHASEEIRAEKVISVTDFEYTMNDAQAVSISFGENDENYCSVTINRASVVAGYTASSIQNGNKNISADCSWNGKQYVQSSRHKTQVNVKIESLDQNLQKAQLKISSKLVNPSTGAFIELTETNLTISDQQYKNLVKVF